MRSSARSTSFSHLQGGGRERWVLWHGILCEEPTPTGSRPRDLIGLYGQQKNPHPADTQGRARREHGGEQGHPEEALKIPRLGNRAIYIVSGTLGVFVRLKVVHLEKISKTSVASERGHFSI